MTKNLIVRVVRWIAIIPAAIIGISVGSLYANLSLSILDVFMEVPQAVAWVQINIMISASIISAGSAVYFGTRTAPNHRKIVSIVLAVIVVGMAAASLLGGFTEEGNPLWRIVVLTSAALAAGYVAYGFFKEGDVFVLTKENL